MLWNIFAHFNRNSVYLCDRKPFSPSSVFSPNIRRLIVHFYIFFSSHFIFAFVFLLFFFRNLIFNVFFTFCSNTAEQCAHLRFPKCWRFCNYWRSTSETTSKHTYTHTLAETKITEKKKKKTVGSDIIEE